MFLVRTFEKKEEGGSYYLLFSNFLLFFFKMAAKSKVTQLFVRDTPKQEFSIIPARGTKTGKGVPYKEQSTLYFFIFFSFVRFKNVKVAILFSIREDGLCLE